MSINISTSYTPPATAEALFYDYLAHRSGESLRYRKLAVDAMRVLEICDESLSSTSADHNSKNTPAKAFGLLAKPLIRQGVLEFRGAGTYGLGATAAYRDAFGNDVLINYPLAEEKFQVVAVAPGVVKINPKRLIGVYASDYFDGLALLKGMPPLDQLVKDSPVFLDSFQRQPGGSWLRLSRNGWVKHDYELDHGRVDLFKGREQTTSNRYIRLDGQIFTIPPVDLHSSAFALGLLLRDALEQGQLKKMFSFEQDGFVVTGDYFPAELERLLWLECLLTSGVAVDSFAERRMYSLSEEILLQLRRILLVSSESV